MRHQQQILSYAKPPPPSGVDNGLRIIGAAVCVFTALAGLGILLLGVVAFLGAAFAEMPAIDRPPALGEAAVFGAIGLVMLVFSVRWLLAAVRAVRRTRVEVGADVSDSTGAADRASR